ncbi:enoyl-CoA hydratase/isomerase [Coccidioides immitis RS]|uniref:Enoyl-CoA hydratase/isomerase n=6 Tax=Coccidioides TaxID=5500 RepID=A0A0E1RXJ3_COCIM|nr:enoyl-CoA hydratase/isomerase [Coccidioides immitis RS]XP_003069024.1 enoyl-CoA hydratase/isomerase family protein [Coccidioides posadasii C735 delta SOWgp]EFW18758.1 enoyl-CoA hydratase/isomerase [Coccidioides posadasii str. Silveira]KMM72397.1 enoyl-CoA hydratase/isomerase family protein [Coccidioides posadasii RMSCC 3488]KMP07253.1 enoyl-CoA hydratase/isomerase family protein [Coccidioides immitis RMSCC 2394]KMU80982.1 enoyl-CoA hydratase/isomerase family protein [Coccidioides immitis RM|eukprot:XP_003069024.1 enoyl-CoA hydratase/isomerase family protein [Coccidioides posadasii C735 delta SOWgp]
MASVTLPTSYAALPTQHIKLSHVPATSPTPTPILLMTLNRPDKLNAFTPTMCNEMVSIFNTVDVDDRVKVVVVTGSGTKAFCAGADLELGFPKGKGKDGHTNRGDVTRPKDHRDGGGRVTLAIHNCRKPTIMALNGSAVGIGITMTLPATIRLATANTKIGFVFARRGLVMEAVSSFFLPRLIGHSRALHVATTGATYPPDHPLLRDLFSEVLPTAQATLDRALEIAEDIAQNTSTVSTSLMRDMMYRGPDSPEGAHLLDSAIIYSLFGGKDNEEGIRSFFEKRKPQFKASVTNPDDMPSFYPWWNPIDLTPRLEKAKL